MNIEIVERLCDHGHDYVMDDAGTVKYVQVPSYHASVSGTNHWARGLTRDEAIGSLIRNCPELFGIKLEFIPGKLPR